MAAKSAIWPEKTSERQWNYQVKVCVMLLIFGIGAFSIKLTITEKYT